MGASTERMKDEAGIALEDRPPATNLRGSVVEVRVPASAGTLGAGSDCFGLALVLYLTVRVTVDPQSLQPCRMRSRGEGFSASLPRTRENLIFRGMRFAAESQV